MSLLSLLYFRIVEYLCMSAEIEYREVAGEYIL